MADNFATIPFPGQYISPNSPQSYQLLSGARFLLPAGNLIAKLGPQTAIQWKDSYSGLWRTFDTGASNSPIQVASDGSNYRVINLSGTISGVGAITAGTLYSQANATVSFGAPATGSSTQTATGSVIVGGSLTFTVATGGTGYTRPIIVVPDPISLGGTAGLAIPATATAALTTGAISSLTAGFAGAGYVTAPSNTAAMTSITVTPAQFSQNSQQYLSGTNIIIIDPTGSGAAITAALANGTAASGGITGVIMTDSGAGYDGTHIPSVTFAGTTGSGASATALPWLALKSITVAGTNTGYSASVMLESTLSSGAGPLAVNDDIPIIRAARAVAAQSAGVLAAPVVEDAGGGFQNVPLIKQVGNATADGSVNASFTAVVGGVTNNLTLWQIG